MGATSVAFRRVLLLLLLCATAGSDSSGSCQGGTRALWPTGIGLDAAIRVDDAFLGSFRRSLLAADADCLRERHLLHCGEDALPGAAAARSWAQAALAQYLQGAGAPDQQQRGGEVEVRIVSSWLETFSSMEWSPPRGGGGGGDLSGVLFVECPSTTGCTATFDDPRALKFVGSSEFTRALGNNAKADMSALGGMAMVFPSHLERYSPPVSGGVIVAVHFTATVTQRARAAAATAGTRGAALAVAFVDDSTREGEAVAHVVPSSPSFQRTELWATSITSLESLRGSSELAESPPAAAGPCVRPGRGHYADSSGVQPLSALPALVRSTVQDALQMHVKNALHAAATTSSVTAELTEVWVSAAATGAALQNAACDRFVHADIRGVVILGAAATLVLDDPRQAARLTDAFGSSEHSLDLSNASAAVFPAWLRAGWGAVKSAATGETDVVAIQFAAVVHMATEGGDAGDLTVRVTHASPEESPAERLAASRSLPAAPAELSLEHVARPQWDWGVNYMQIRPPKSRMERAWMQPFAELVIQRLKAVGLDSDLDKSLPRALNVGHWPSERDLLTMPEESLMGVQTARKWAEAALQAYLTEEATGDSAAAAMATITSSWATQICTGSDGTEPLSLELESLPRGDAGADLTGLLLVSGCGGGGTGSRGCQLMLSDPRPRAAASSEGLADEVGFGRPRTLGLAEASGVIVPSWVERQLIATTGTTAAVGGTGGTSSRSSGNDCGLAISFTAVVSVESAVGRSEYDVDKDVDEDEMPPLPSRRLRGVELVRDAWATPFTVLSPKRSKRKQRAKLVQPLQQTVLGMVSQFPSGKNSNRGGWQLPQRTLLEAADHGYPGVGWARDLIRAAIEAHLLEQLGAGSPEGSSGRSGSGGRRGGLALVEIDSSWANVNYGSDHWNVPHVHISDELTADLSGALYIKCGAKSPCQLALSDPRPGATMTPARHAELNTNASLSTLLRFREGDIVIFPSWLSHYVPPSPQQNQEEPRITMSFNAVVKLLYRNNEEDDSSEEWSVRFQ